MKQQTSFSYWFPFGLRIVYTGTPKTKVEWVRQTWRSYLAVYKLYYAAARNLRFTITKEGE
jgi:hypothetical protein